MEFNYDIAKTVSVSGREQNPAVAKVVALVAGAPFALSLNQIIAVAEAAGVELPAPTTVRNWLQAAAERGEIARPTIRTYAPVEASGDEAEAPEVSEQAAEEVGDPLLDI